MFWPRRRWDFNLQYYRASMVQAAGLQLMDALRAADTELHCYSDALRDLLGSEPDTAAFNRLMTQEGMCAPIREAVGRHAAELGAT